MTPKPRIPHTGYEIEGNVIYLHPRTSPGSTTGPEDFLATLSLETRTALGRLRSSASNRWTPAQIRQKLQALGLSGETMDQALAYITAEDYDPAWVARQELDRRMSRGYGARRIEAELAAQGFERATISGVLEEISRDRWLEVLGEALSGEALPEDPARLKKKMEALQRRGFSIEQILQYAKSRKAP